VGTAEPAKKSRHLLKKGGIRILKDGKLIDEAKDVVRICKTWGAMLGASHLYNEEIMALLRFAKQEKFTKVVITHANWTVLRNVGVHDLKAMAALGAWIEFCGSAMLPPHSCMTVEEELSWLNAIGTKRCILASDAGAQIYGTQPSVFRAYLQLLNNAGLPLAEIKRMAFEAPRHLLNL
jgi:hypothetical protein